jgi:hypothetical protein
MSPESERPDTPLAVNLARIPLHHLQTALDQL